MKAGGRGIQKICDTCKNLGAEKPEYIVHGEDIMVKFKALQNVKMTKKVTEKIINTLTENEKKVLQILEDNPFATYMEIADRLAVSRKTVSQKIKVLKDKGYIVRMGSTKKDIGKSYKNL